MKSINTGAPHFRSIAKQHRHANYTLDKVINEAIDNVIKKATEIHITTTIDDMGRLQELKISDNYIDGFENIDREGTACPLNMGHIRDGHDCDDETSEFGVGLKAGALNAGNKLEVITRIGKTGKCVKVVCDFQRMMNEVDVINSYNPVMREASIEEYTEYHPFGAGSSIIVSQIRENICKATKAELITHDILDGISNTYSRLLCDARKISVNGVVAEKEHDFFADPKCALFTVKKEIVMLCKGNETKIMARKIVKTTTWQEFIVADNKWCALQGGADTFNNYLRDGYKHLYADADGSCIKVESTFTRFSEHHASLSSASDLVHIYKDRRKYGKKSFVKHNDGYDNYTMHKIDFKAKPIGKILGITYNKEITMDGNNDLINALKSAVGDHRKEFRTSTELKYCALFDKALEGGIMHWKTCKHDLLPEKYKILRDDYDRTLLITSAPAPAPVVSESDSDEEDEPVIIGGEGTEPVIHAPEVVVAPVIEEEIVAPVIEEEIVAPVIEEEITPVIEEEVVTTITNIIEEVVVAPAIEEEEEVAPAIEEEEVAPAIEEEEVAPITNTIEEVVVAPVITIEETSEAFVKQYCQYLMHELAEGSIATKSLDEVKAWMMASIAK
jgi:hypothetical protein